MRRETASLFHLRAKAPPDAALPLAGEPAISAPGAEKERLEVEFESLVMSEEEASRLQGLDGSAGHVAGGGEGGAVEFAEGGVVDVDFAGHFGRKKLGGGKYWFRVFKSMRWLMRGVDCCIAFGVGVYFSYIAGHLRASGIVCVGRARDTNQVTI